MKPIVQRLLACAVAIAALHALPSVSVALPPGSPPPGGCRYVEAGPPGPAGNRLFVDQNYGGVRLLREGDAIVVYSPYHLDKVLDCEGAMATVRNIDRIVYRPLGGGDPPRISHRLAVDLEGGPFAPGASPDHSRGGREIEIFAEFPAEPHDKWSSVFVKGSEGADWMRVGALSRGRTGINLDLRHDRSVPDADLIASAATDAHFSLRGEAGDDRIGATGMGAEFEGPIRQGSLEIRGGAGRDAIYAGPERDFLRGDDGGDTIYGEDGRDRIDGDEGSDRLFGGAGDDEIRGGWDEQAIFYDLLSGGSGHDALHAIDGNTDAVGCGAGPDQAYIDAVDDWSRATCEHQHGPDFN